MTKITSSFAASILLIIFTIFVQPSTSFAEGALAKDESNGKLGISANAINKQEAENAALKFCNSDGCRIVGSFKNACAAWAADKFISRSFVAPKIEETIKGALQECGKLSANCKIVLNNCDKSIQGQTSQSKEDEVPHKKIVKNTAEDYGIKVPPGGGEMGSVNSIRFPAGTTQQQIDNTKIPLGTTIVDKDVNNNLVPRPQTTTPQQPRTMPPRVVDINSLKPVDPATAERLNKMRGTSNLPQRSNPAGSNWSFLVQSPDKNITTYVRANSAQRNGDHGRVMILYDFKDSPPNTNYKSTIATMEAECDKKSVQGTFFSQYSENMGQGNLLRSGATGADQYVQVTPGSLYETIFNLACNK